jgi:5'(3')-deoxyribonucleotidase
MMIDFETMWSQQREYSRGLADVGEMLDALRVLKTREFGHELHSEVSRLVECVGFRDGQISDVDRHRLLSDSVDIVRYGIAVCNLWDFTVEEFMSAWIDRELHLSEQHRLLSNVWDGRPVIICDIDDVLADFRMTFITWITTETGISLEHDDDQFYLVDQLVRTGMTSHEHFVRFIKQRHLHDLPALQAVKVINDIHDRGIWIHLVTARPGDDVTCVHDTYRWLHDVGVKYDAITFTHEKVTFVTDTQYHAAGAIVTCVDDSPQHVNDYVSHGLKCMMPMTAYNASVVDCDLLTRYKDDTTLQMSIDQLLEQFIM